MSKARTQLRRALHPKTISGLQFWGEIDLGGIPGCVTFPADPLTNGNFEGAAGPPPNGWTAFQCVGTREAGTRTGGSGSYVGQVAHDGVNAYGQLYQGGFTVGNKYIITGWAKTSNIATLPTVRTGAGTLLWTGAASLSWQSFSATFVADHTQIFVGSSTLSAGTNVQWDDIVISPQNVNQLTDLSGLGHHLLQATAANQPLWVSSGTSGLLRFNGTTNYLKANTFTLNQPAHIFVATKWTFQADARYLVDGFATNNMGLYHGAGTAVNSIYSTAAGFAAAPITGADGYNRIIDAVYNGASSAMGLNGGTFSTGTCGATAGAGLTLGTVGGAGGFYAVADVYALLAFNRQLTAAERARMILYLKQKASKAGAVI